MIKSRQELLILIGVIFISAAIGLGGVYLFAGRKKVPVQETVLSEQLPTVPEEILPENAAHEEPLPEEDMVEEPPVIEIIPSKDGQDIQVVTDKETVDVDEYELLKELVRQAGGDESRVSPTREPSNLEVLKSSTKELMSRVQIETQFSGESDGKGLQKVVIDISNNSDSIFEGYVFFEFIDAAGNRIDMQFVNIARANPGEKLQYLLWVGDKSTSTKNNIVGKFTRPASAGETGQ